MASFRHKDFFPPPISISKATSKLASDRFPVMKGMGSDSRNVWVVRMNMGK